MLVQTPPAIVTFPMVLVPTVLVKVITPFTVVRPETVKLNPPILRVEPEAMLTFVQEALALPVTVQPPSTKALSAGPGAVAPEAPPEVADQVPAAFQFPVATE